MTKYKINKVLNNNVIILQGKADKFYIVIGPGIGYKEEKGNSFYKFDNIRQVFELKNAKVKKDFQQILVENDANLIAFIEEVISYVQEQYETTLNEKIHITLAEHLTFALERNKNGLDFHNPYNNAISLLYKKEYALSEQIVNKFNEKFNANLINDEKGIIAIHIHSAIKGEDIAESRKKQNLYLDTLHALYQAFDLRYDESTLEYQRLLLHITYAYNRIFNKELMENVILDVIMNKYEEYFKVVKSALVDIANKYDIEIPDAEIGYLVIHVMRLKK